MFKKHSPECVVLPPHHHNNYPALPFRKSPFVTDAFKVYWSYEQWWHLCRLAILQQACGRQAGRLLQQRHIVPAVPVSLCVFLSCGVWHHCSPPLPIVPGAPQPGAAQAQSNSRRHTVQTADENSMDMCHSCFALVLWHTLEIESENWKAWECDVSQATACGITYVAAGCCVCAFCIIECACACIRLWSRGP